MAKANDPLAARLRKLDGRILLIRGQRVWLDSDLAEIFDFTRSQLIRQFKRHQARFPSDFAFQLTRREASALQSHNGTFPVRRTSSVPWVFSEGGTLILAGVLNSTVAVDVSVCLVRAFIRMQKMTTPGTMLPQLQGFQEFQLQ